MLTKGSINSKPKCDKDHKFIPCHQCAMESICLPINTQQQPIELTQQYLTKRVDKTTNSYLFKQGQSLTSIYAICTGTFKLTKHTQINDEKVIGFKFPGEIIGHDALHPKIYSHNAIALDDASVCEVNVAKLLACSYAVPNLQLSLVDLLTRQSYIAQKQYEVLIAKSSAESLVAAFILNVKKRYSDVTGAKNQVLLTMSRDNIANFLGLRRETLSRVLSKFQKEKFITISNKLIQIDNLAALFKLANL